MNYAATCIQLSGVIAAEQSKALKLSTLFACTTLSSSWFQSTVVLGKECGTAKNHCIILHLSFLKTERHIDVRVKNFGRQYGVSGRHLRTYVRFWEH